VDLFDEDGEREPVAVAHIDPAKLQMAEALRAYEPEHLDPDQGLGRVKRTGEALLFAQVPDQMLAAAAVDEEHLRLLRTVGIHSVLIVPMTLHGRVMGTLTLVNAESGRTFDQGDLEFAGQIAERAALAVENARLYTERSAVAMTLQHSLLPEALPHIPGWEIAALYRPSGHGSEVGGDFYDFWETGGDWLMMIGDVTGKGVGAAAVTSLVRHTARAASDFDQSPARILKRIDGALLRGPSLSVCTALCLRLSAGRVVICAGGHLLPLCCGHGQVRELGSHGTLLGAFPDVDRSETQFELAAGETLVAFTDGVTDTLGADGERFGSERLQAILAESQNDTPMAIRQRLVEALEEFQVGSQADDTAVVVMRYTGAPEDSSNIKDQLDSAQQGSLLHGQSNTV
jgi:serine phosphatase RsbU (regulator of sigma subunit)